MSTPAIPRRDPHRRSLRHRARLFARWLVGVEILLVRVPGNRTAGTTSNPGLAAHLGGLALARARGEGLGEVRYFWLWGRGEVVWPWQVFGRAASALGHVCWGRRREGRGRGGEGVGISRWVRGAARMAEAWDAQLDDQTGA